jgi:Leucine-rich repeat (LRR) protein/GTPase SAR1 family protein
MLAATSLKSVPSWLSKLASLTELDLSSNQLTSLPDWLGNLTGLTELNLSGNQLTSLPDSLGNLTGLTELGLSQNELSSLPDSLGNLTSLTELDLSGNKLTSLPDWLGNLTGLTELDLNGNKLTSLPDSLGNLTGLTELDLSGNKLTLLPDWLGNLTGLTELNLGGNKLTSLPDWLGNLIGLIKLDVYECELTSLPDWLSNLTSLTELNLGGNKLTSLPHSLRNLTGLLRLFMWKNQFTSLPDWLGNLTSLTYLTLGGNQLTSLPDSLGNLTSLARLSMYSNELVSLPGLLRNLTALTGLDLSRNELSSLPDWLGDLTALTELDLNGNKLTSLPDSLGDLTGLTELDLNGNKLTSLPDSLGNLTSLTKLNVSGNKLTALPRQLADLLTGGMQLDWLGNPLGDPIPELAERGSVALAAYLRSLKDAVAQYEAKVLLVGEGNVGKTSLVAALRGAMFVRDRPTTHGIEISPISFRHPGLGIDMTLRLWDFGGQEVYRVSHQFFLSQRALYLVVWHSRQGQEHDEVEGWLRRIRLRVGHDTRAILVATHCAERLPELDYSHLEGLFPGMLVGNYEVDSSTGLGLSGLRKAIAEQAAQLPQMGQLISPRWIAAREAIMALGITEQQIRYEKFTEICELHGLSGPEINTLAKLMHDLGLIIYYGEDEGLKDIVVLNPEWLTKAISYVLEDGPTRQAGGVLDHTRLKQIWHGRNGEYAPRYHPYFLRLMEKFDISYRLDGDEAHSLVAQLVPHQRPALPWQPGIQLPAGVRKLTLVCRLSEPAPGLIPWLTVRHHRASTGTHWRRGVFLRHPIATYASEAIVELRNNTELTVEVRAPSPDLYFNVLRDSIEDLIIRRWPGLTYRLYVPCPGRTYTGSPCPGQFPLDGLLRQREGGQAVVACMDCPGVHEISALLTGFAVPGQPIAAELEQMYGQLTDIKSSITGIQGQAAEIAETVRRVQRVISTEVTDCPRLFTLAQDRPAGSRRTRIYQHHYRLTLWCEHAGYEHPWEAATYELDPPKEWFTRIAPYATLVFRTLQLIVPLTGAVAIASLPQAQRGSAQAHLQVMSTLVANLPSTGEPKTFGDNLGGATGQLTAAEGQALRAVRTIIFEHDPLQAFGGLRRVQAPSGDLLWVCTDHYSEYDPGLPIIS